MQNLSVVYVDAGGATAITLLHLTDAAILTDGIAAISGATNGDWAQYWGGTTFDQTPPAPVAAPYQTLRPVASLLFQCADGTTVEVGIPAPVLALFLTDGETVDPADPLGAIAALLAIITGATGSPASAFIGGHLGTK